MNNKPELKKIRELTRADRKKLTKIFKKAMLELKDNSLKNIISSKNNSKNSEDESVEMASTIVNFGVGFIEKALDVVDDDLGEWFASLLGVTIEEFDQMPIDIEFKILEQIRADPAAENFFTQCWQRAKMMNVLEAPLRAMRGRFGSILEEAKQSS